MKAFVKMHCLFLVFSGEVIVDKHLALNKVGHGRILLLSMVFKGEEVLEKDVGFLYFLVNEI